MDDTTRAALLEWFDTYIVADPDGNFDVDGYSGYGGGDLTYEVQNMASALYGGYTSNPAPLPEVESMIFVPECDGDGIIDGFSMRVAIEKRGDHLLSWSRYLSTYIDWKSVTDDREAVSTDAAWNIVTSLADAWLALHADVLTIRAALNG